MLQWQFHSYDELSDSDDNGRYVESDLGTVCKLINSICTVIQLYVIWDMYNARANSRINPDTRKPYRTIWAAGLTKLFLIEFIVNAIHVPPFMATPKHGAEGKWSSAPCSWEMEFGGLEQPEGELMCKNAQRLYRQFGTSYDELSVFVAIRFYQLFRYLHQKSPLHKISRNVEMGEVQAKTGIKRVSMFFVLRCYFQQSPWKCAWYATIFALLSFAYTVYVFERVVQPEEWGTRFGYFSALYWAAITMTSTGYGDFVPKRLIARFVTANSALVGLLLSATFVFAMMKSVQLKPTELSALKWLHDKISVQEQKRYTESRNSEDSRRRSIVGHWRASITKGLASPKKPRRFSFLDPNLETLRMLKQRQQSAKKNCQDIKYQLDEIKALIRNEDPPERPKEAQQKSNLNTFYTGVASDESPDLKKTSRVGIAPSDQSTPVKLSKDNVEMASVSSEPLDAEDTQRMRNDMLNREHDLTGINQQITELFEPGPVDDKLPRNTSGMVDGK